MFELWSNLVSTRKLTLIRTVSVMVLAAVALVLGSTITNLALERLEQSSIGPYGEKIPVNGGALNVYRNGHAGQTIVLLSGYGTAAPALDYAPLIRELGNYNVVVVEGFGYGYSNKNAGPRTIENISAELHTALATLNIPKPYVLAGHSLAGFYTLYYSNHYPGEVSAVIGIDPTVPADTTGQTDASGGGTNWERMLSTTGVVRIATSIDPNLARPAGDAYSTSELERIRLMTSWNYGNPALADEGKEMANNARKLHGLSYPDALPVLTFLSTESMASMPQWYDRHERQLRNVQRHEIVVLDGGHYLHWTQSRAMAKAIGEFLGRTPKSP